MIILVMFLLGMVIVFVGGDRKFIIFCWVNFYVLCYVNFYLDGVSRGILDL